MKYSIIIICIFLFGCDNGGGWDTPIYDRDSDAILNDSDNCADITNPDQLNTDGDELGDACDSDIDNDTVVNENDNCPLHANEDQLNTDDDEFGDACDSDIDNDSVVNEDDNCPLLANEDQLNTDSDELGDACDTDIDNDSFVNADDNCALLANEDQLNTDDDELGDACDSDIDNDSVINEDDNCPLHANENQLNIDNDELGDACDESNDSYNGTWTSACEYDELADVSERVIFVVNGSSGNVSYNTYDGDNACEGTFSHVSETQLTLTYAGIIDLNDCYNAQNVNADIVFPVIVDNTAYTKGQLMSNGFSSSEFNTGYSLICLSQDGTTLYQGHESDVFIGNDEDSRPIKANISFPLIKQ